MDLKTVIKPFLFPALIAGIGLLSSCSSDDEHKDGTESLLLHGNQVVKTVNNHPGTIHYDSELKMWYIDYSYDRLVGVMERLYTESIDNDFQKEGLPVVFSGETFDFYAKKENKARNEYDYYLMLQDISKSNHLCPLVEVEPLIKDFLDNATSSGEDMCCQFDFPESTLEEKLVDTCYVINNHRELDALYKGQKTIPDVDFEKYTLVIGRAYMPHTGESLGYHDVSSEGKNINLYIEAYPVGLDVIELDYFWGLYPKFETDILTCSRNVTKIEVNYE
jgi:hypothetical protein